MLLFAFVKVHSYNRPDANWPAAISRLLIPVLTACAVVIFVLLRRVGFLKMESWEST